MEVTVESKLYATGPLVMDHQHNGGPALLIERIDRVSEEKPPVLLL